MNRLPGPRPPCSTAPSRNGLSGLTLVELLIGSAVLAAAAMAFVTALMHQMILLEHSRNVTWATIDAARVLERLRLQNSGGVCMGVAPPAGFADWDAWLQAPIGAGGGGKTIQPDPSNNERVAVNPPVGADPLVVTVAVCWRHRGRLIGTCVPNGAALADDPDGVTDSPALIASQFTCR
jgi:hypothetical protein